MHVVNARNNQLESDVVYRFIKPVGRGLPRL